nr:hypothetical protein [Klebsiella pneumoniae]
MMNAGLPVVEVWRENNLYDFSEDAMLLCKQTPESIATGIMKILNDADLAASMELGWSKVYEWAYPGNGNRRLLQSVQLRDERAGIHSRSDFTIV